MISIHALRVEGDIENYLNNVLHLISIHALRVEGDESGLRCAGGFPYFYPRPPGGGRRRVEADDIAVDNFYPRPPGGGRLVGGLTLDPRDQISIHALRVEGDHRRRARPVRGAISIHALRVEGDAKIAAICALVARYFYPRPPGGGRHVPVSAPFASMLFLSTPSGWRATQHSGASNGGEVISIHALRVEGDQGSAYRPPPCMIISIHALRVEGDSVPGHGCKHRLPYFYPRPPGGGRPGLQ